MIFDDTGLFAMCCRHDVSLLIANIDTPGEQQKYPIALLEELFKHIPSTTTVTALYDVGCVLHRSCQKVYLSRFDPMFSKSYTNLIQYDILPPAILSRLTFATPAMHSYAHRWYCQVVYNCQFQLGMGLSDGKSNERLWSQLRGLIGPSQSSGVSSTSLDILYSLN